MKADFEVRNADDGTTMSDEKRIREAVVTQTSALIILELLLLWFSKYHTLNVFIRQRLIIADSGATITPSQRR